MIAYKLLHRLQYLTLTVENDNECWEERLVFIGNLKQWQLVANVEHEYEKGMGE